MRAMGLMPPATPGSGQGHQGGISRRPRGSLPSRILFLEESTFFFFLYNKHHTVELLKVNEIGRAAENGCCGNRKLCLTTQPFWPGMIGFCKDFPGAGLLTGDRVSS